VFVFHDNEYIFNLPPVYKVQCERGGRHQSQVHPISHVVRNAGQQHQTECVEHTRHHGNERPVVRSDEFQS